MLLILQIEIESNHFSKNVVVTSDGPSLTTQVGYVNNAFEDGPQKADKVNDKHNAHTNITNYLYSAT